MAKDDKKFTIMGVEIIFRNFEGKTGPFNDRGQKEFSIIIPDEKVAQQMLKDGWAVKYLEPREEGDEAVPYISVNVSYKNRPPRVVMITSAGARDLNEDTIEILDAVDIANADIICNAYEWAVGDKTGTKAYLKSLFVTVAEDELELKYAAELAGPQHDQHDG